VKCFIVCAYLVSIAAVPLEAGWRDEPRPNTLTAKEMADGWILLFDSETTFGWKIDGDATVKDGVLVLGGTKPTTAVSTTAFDWSNSPYSLTMDMQYEGEKPPLFLFAGGMVQPSTNCKGQFVTQKADVKSTQRFPAPAPTPEKFEIPAGSKLLLKNIKFQPRLAKSIFNGKDLTGWKEIPGKKSKFSVTPEGWLNIKDGPGDIQTEGQWANFIVQIDVLSNGPHLNSGVFFRCLPGQFWSGYEAQIRNEWISDVVLKDGTRITGSYTPKGDQASIQVYAKKDGKWQPTRETKKLATTEIKDVIDHRDQPIDFGTGAIYNRQPARKVVSNDYAWYTMTVIAQGEHIATWVNGYQTADFTDQRPANVSARNGSKVDKGPISLQGHDPTTDLSFRNIRIAELGGRN
jgi:Domain of Unknown Function (DUF1080)